MIYIAGQIFQAGVFREGYLGIERGTITETGDGDPPSRPVATGIVTPPFINCHTHVADAAVKVDPSLCLEDLVAPPHGLKHRALAAMDDACLRASIGKALRMMRETGTSHFIDFREGGVTGAAALASMEGPPASVVMGRPAGLVYDHEEVDALLDISDGIAISSVSDWPSNDLDKLAEHVHRRGKPFSLHVSESRREDIERVISLQPRFIVHMSSATRTDMKRVADEGIPTVVCPRSNLFMGIVPPLAVMVQAGMEIALGTDNFMVSDGDMRAEAECMARLLRSQGGDAAQALESALVASRKLLNLDSELPLSEGRTAELVVFNGRGSDPVCDLLFRSGGGVSLVCTR